MDRRSFLTLAGGGTAAVATATLIGPAAAPAGATTTAPASRLGRAQVPPAPFSLGVASGDPDAGSVVLWTRLAPDPLVPGGGMPSRPVPVRWEVATDERFRRVVRRGTEHARPDSAHTVHAEVGGLAPGAHYFYRFRAGDEVSPVGRTRTAPHPRSRDGVRFAMASCQHYETGFYTAHRAIAGEDLDFVVFLGDYIYEGRPNPSALRQHDGADEPYTLDAYRARHARYRSDPDLQASHGAFPWIVTLDDHEIDNNWADDVPQDPQNQTPEAFRARRIAAFRAYWEHMPLRRSALPSGPDMQLHRRLSWGETMQIDVLDTRQHRSDQITSVEQSEDPARTMLGAEQERWLDHGLARSRARWNTIAQQTMVAQNDRTAGPTATFDFDNWDGYRAPRRRLLASLDRVRNPVVLTGDRHCIWISDLREDFDDPASPTVAAELTGTSITSGGDANPDAFHAQFDPIMADSPHWKFIDNRRGYLRCDVNRDRWLTDLRVVSTVLSQQATVSTFASFVTEDGRRGVEVA